MDRFNNDKRIFCFILSTRSGGVGVNLTGADTVIFYDNDWNPTMDAQAQDRCHRIGQTREVHIYRMVTQKTVEENILKKAQQKRQLASLAVESGAFTTDFFNVQDFFADEDIEVGEGPKGDGKDIEAAMRDAEDGDDRDAAKLAEKEVSTELAEFDESKPFPEDAKAYSSTSESEGGATEDESLVDLKAQLAGLKGVEKHATTVLERYLTPMHQTKLEAARQALEGKEAQLKEMEARIKESEEAMSEDDDEIFFDPTEAYEAYAAEVLKDQGVYTPPNPFAPEEVYIEPSHAMQYRVGYMTFSPLPPLDDRDPRQRRRRKHNSERRMKRRALNGNFENDMGHLKKRRRMHPDMPRRAAIRSLFRKLEDVRNRGAVKHKHPKRPSKFSSSTNSKREVDSNKDAPAFLIDEDYQLLRLVRRYLSQHNGSVNWHLVSDAFNTSTSFTGRHRSKNQCRDRYFRTIMLREEGKLGEESREPDPPPKKKKKDKREEEPALLPKKLRVPQTTEKLHSHDKNRSLYQFHSGSFLAVQKAIQQTRKEIKPVKAKPHASHDVILNSILNHGGAGAQKGPLTPTQLSDRRLQKDQQKKKEEAQTRAGAAAAAAAGAATAGYATGPAAATGQATGDPATWTAHQLTTFYLGQFKSPEAQRAIMSIYQNASLVEAAKRTKLIALIQSFKQQIAALKAKQGQHFAAAGGIRSPVPRGPGMAASPLPGQPGQQIQSPQALRRAYAVASPAMAQQQYAGQPAVGSPMQQQQAYAAQHQPGQPPL